MSISIIPSILNELQKQYGITYEDAIQLQDEHGDNHNFYLATINDANVLFDESGQVWMNAAEMVIASDMTKGAVNNALTRLKASSLWDVLARVHNLYTRDSVGRRVNLAFYNEATLAAIITRQQEASPKALQFLEERENIIAAVRKLLHDYSMYTNDQNQALKQHLEGLQFALSEEQKEKRLLEWKVEDYKAERERKNRDNLDLYDWNNL